MTKEQAVKNWLARREEIALAADKHRTLLETRKNLEKQAEVMKKSISNAESEKIAALKAYSEGHGSESAFEKASNHFAEIAGKLSGSIESLGSNERSLNELMAGGFAREQNLIEAQRLLFAALLPELQQEITELLAPKMRMLYAISERAGICPQWPPNHDWTGQLFGQQRPDTVELRGFYDEAKRMLRIEGYGFSHLPGGLS